MISLAPHVKRSTVPHGIEREFQGNPMGKIDAPAAGGRR